MWMDRLAVCHLMRYNGDVVRLKTAIIFYMYGVWMMDSVRLKGLFGRITKWYTCNEFSNCNFLCTRKNLCKFSPCNMVIMSSTDTHGSVSYFTTTLKVSAHHARERKRFSFLSKWTPQALKQSFALVHTLNLISSPNHPNLTLKSFEFNMYQAFGTWKPDTKLKNF